MDDYLPTCPNCRKFHPERAVPGNAKCESCRVQLVEENEDAAEVYMATRRQYVTRMEIAVENGVPYPHTVIVDISIPAVESAMRIRGVKDQWDCLVKVRQAFHHFLGER